MTARERLPNRRQCESFEFRHAGHPFTLCAGFYADGRIAEIFLSSHKPARRSRPSPEMRPSRRVLRFNLARTSKRSWQALTRDHDGGPATLLGAALDALAEAAR
jgi:hypothetical protein